MSIEWTLAVPRIQKSIDIYKLVTIVKGDLKVLFSIATTLRCGEGTTSFPGMLHFTLDMYLTMLSVKQGRIKYHFLSLWYDLIWDWSLVFQAIG